MRVNVWIRKENEQAWSELTNKSEWLNERLSKPSRVFYDETQTIDPKVLDSIKIPKSPNIITGTTKPGMFDHDTKFCKHDAVLGMCKKNCK